MNHSVKNYISFAWNPYLKTDGTGLLILFFVKDFKEKEIAFLKERVYQKIPLKRL